MSKVMQQLKNDPLMPLRHTCEHVLHAVMQEMYPSLKKVMGPPIENGFYFDFDLDEKVTAEDFEKIEARMQQIIAENLEIIKHETTYKEAREKFKDNPYKLATIDEIEARGEGISLYSMGKKDNYFDVDLCSGPHTKSTGDIKAFKLLSVAGAYYRGDEKNKMLQRIYGTAFDSKEGLEQYLQHLETARKNEHKKLGVALELYMFHETAPGMAYWLPKGVTLYNELVEFWRKEHQLRGYKEIFSPLINKKELYEISGHWEHYLDDMFIADMGENEIYCLKPMNCPNAMVVFGSKSRSYRELPLRLGDTDCLHRYERSGTLNGLLRIREFRQDDAHIFVSEDQIKSEFESLFEITEKFYSIFGLQYTFRLGTRPEKFMGDPKFWDIAEKELTKILENSGKDYFVLEGDGAFYGPKIDILMKDALGRDWQMGTLQLDFQIPQKFDLKYVAPDGTLKTPVVIHRVVYGSLERFIGILIEHFGGALPMWLAPVQVQIVPISEKHLEYSQKVAQSLIQEGLRVEVDINDGTMQNKIRHAQEQKIPYMLVLGDKEVETKTASLRLRSGENVGALDINDLSTKLRQKYLDKSLDLW